MGCALSGARIIETPLGNFESDQEIIKELMKSKKFVQLTKFHDEQEHSLEMQFPFLSLILDKNTKIVPIMVGSIDTNDVTYEQVLRKYFEDEESVFVFSTDFCHWGNGFSYTPFKDEKQQIYKSIEKLDKEGFNFIKNKNSK